MSRNQLVYAALAALVAVARDYMAYLKSLEQDPDARYDWRMVIAQFVMGLAAGLGIGTALPE